MPSTGVRCMEDCSVNVVSGRAAETSLCVARTESDSGTPARPSEGRQMRECLFPKENT